MNLLLSLLLLQAVDPGLPHPDDQTASWHLETSEGRTFTPQEAARYHLEQLLGRVAGELSYAYRINTLCGNASRASEVESDFMRLVLPFAGDEHRARLLGVLSESEAMPASDEFTDTEPEQDEFTDRDREEYCTEEYLLGVEETSYSLAEIAAVAARAR